MTTQRRRGPTPRRTGRAMVTGNAVRIAVENINHPGKSRLVDAAKYRTMRQALLKTLPTRAPGRMLADVSDAVLRHLPATLFPGGAHAGWWLKTVQLDLEAKGLIARDKATPLRLHRR